MGHGPCGWMGYPQKTATQNDGKSPLFMGKLAILTGPFSIANCERHYQRVTSHLEFVFYPELTAGKKKKRLSCQDQDSEMALQELRFRFGPLLGQQPQFQVIQEQKILDGWDRGNQWESSPSGRSLQVREFKKVSVHQNTQFSMIKSSLGVVFHSFSQGAEYFWSCDNKIEL